MSSGQDWGTTVPRGKRQLVVSVWELLLALGVGRSPRPECCRCPVAAHRTVSITETTVDPGCQQGEAAGSGLNPADAAPCLH